MQDVSEAREEEEYILLWTANRKVPASGVPLAASTICSAIDLVLE